MDYAARLPSPRSVLVPVVALAIGAAGAVGVYAAVDGTETGATTTRVIVADPPVQPGEGTAAKDEAATAAAVGNTEAHKGGGPPAETDGRD